MASLTNRDDRGRTQLVGILAPVSTRWTPGVARFVRGAGCLLFVLLWISPSVSAQEDADTVSRRLAGLHSSSGTTLPPLDPAEWTEAQIKRIRKLEAFYVCACKKENYTKTLEGCPDACADEQKALIRTSVKDGKSDADIKREMVNRYTARVLGAPGWEGMGKLTYIIPVTVILLSFAVGLLILRAWRRSGSAARATRTEENQWVQDDALDQVRRELDRIE